MRSQVASLSSIYTLPAIPLRMHGAGKIYLHENHEKNQPNVGKYTKLKDCMGILQSSD